MQKNAIYELIRGYNNAENFIFVPRQYWLPRPFRICSLRNISFFLLYFFSPESFFYADPARNAGCLCAGLYTQHYNFRK